MVININIKRKTTEYFLLTEWKGKNYIYDFPSGHESEQTQSTQFCLQSPGRSYHGLLQ